jgi:YafQ family addiction module toxin component
MEFSLEIPDHLEDIFNKLLLKDKHQLEIINKKIIQILLNPYLFKPLRGEMKGTRRVHVAKSFVLVYEIDENNKIIRLLDYNHHDKIYRK